MKRLAFNIFLISAIFAGFLAPQAALAGQDDGIILRVTALDSPPQGTIVINGGDDYTNSSSVNLTLYAWDTESGVAEMQFSNNGIDWSTPEVYAASKAWALSAGDGEKTVYAKFKDIVGRWSGAITDTIILSNTVTTTIDYSYDDLNRLKTITHSGENTAYTYDEVGNIVTKTTTGN